MVPNLDFDTVFLVRFIFDIYKAEGRPESKDQIRKIPLLVPKVIMKLSFDLCQYKSLVSYLFHLQSQFEKKNSGTAAERWRGMW